MKNLILNTVYMDILTYTIHIHLAKHEHADLYIMCSKMPKIKKCMYEQKREILRRFATFCMKTKYTSHHPMLKCKLMSMNSTLALYLHI